MKRMSSSVRVARTRIWRMAAAITRGGNLCGAMWQRPQFVRKRFSPSMRSALSTAAASLLGGTAGFAECVARAGSVVLFAADAAEVIVTVGGRGMRSCAITEIARQVLVPRKENRKSERRIFISMRYPEETRIYM